MLAVNYEARGSGGVSLGNGVILVIDGDFGFGVFSTAFVCCNAGYHERTWEIWRKFGIEH